MMVAAGLIASGVLGITKSMEEYRKRRARVFYITGRPPAITPAITPAPNPSPGLHRARLDSSPPQDLMPYVVAGAVFGVF